MTRDVWYWLFILCALILGWVIGRGRDKFKDLYTIIEQLKLERDAQARTIQFQRKVIAELEKDKGIGSFRAAFAQPKKQEEEGSNQ